MKLKTLKKILVGRPLEQVSDIMKMNGWSLVDANDKHMVFSDGFNSVDVYVSSNIANRIT